MTETVHYPMTHQGVRDLNNPIRPGRSRVNVGPTERAVSNLGGALLAGFGLGRGGVAGLALAAVGGALVYRGATGHCHAYAAAGVSTAR
jgi:uncharacterized membrane protein